MKTEQLPYYPFVTVFFFTVPLPHKTEVRVVTDSERRSLDWG